jgi:Mrp family chromosome partitioning ATPase
LPGHWRAGLGVGLAVFVLATLGALAIPQVYESSALLEVTGVGATDEGARADGHDTEAELLRAVHDAPWLADLVAEAGGPTGDLEQVRAAIEVVARSPRTFGLAFRARTAKAALGGCTKLAEGLVAHFGVAAGPRSGGGSPAERQAHAALDASTKELADFVVLHPDVVLESGSAPVAKSSAAPEAHAAPPDPTITVLRQEKARLEADLGKANAEQRARAKHFNPYDDPPEIADPEALRGRIAAVRAAIIARQQALADRAALRALSLGPASSPSAATAPAAPSATAPASEWRRLVRAVTDAQRSAHAEPPEHGSTLTARIVEAPSLPEGPVTPRRSLVVGVGGCFGALLGLLTALVQARRGTPQGRSPSESAESEPVAGPTADGAPRGAGAPPTAGQAGAAAAYATVSVGGERGPPPAAGGPSPRGGLESAPFAPMTPRNATDASGVPGSESERARAARSDAEGVRIPPAPAMPTVGQAPSGTQVGMIDVALVKARTGSTPITMAPRVEPRPILDVTADRTSAVPAAPASVSRPEEPAPVTRRAGTPSGMPARSERPRSDTGYSFVDRSPRSGSRRDSLRPGAEHGSEALVSMRPSAEREAPAPPRPQEDRTDERRTSTRPGLPAAPMEQSAVDPRRSDRPPPMRPTPDRPGPSPVITSTSITRTGWARPTPPATAGASSPPETAIVATGRLAEDHVVEPQSAPPSWRLRPGLASQGPDDELCTLRDQISDLARQKPFVVAVTSEPEASEAKSRIAARLAALLAADGGQRVLLLEANFDFPSVHRVLAVDMPPFFGFSQQMRARIRAGTTKPWAVIRCSPTLHVLGEGLLRSPGIIFAQEFGRAVAELRRYFDVIVIDGPFIGMGAEHKPLDDVTDGVVIAVPALDSLLEALERGAPWFTKKELMAAVPADHSGGETGVSNSPTS